MKTPNSNFEISVNYLVVWGLQGETTVLKDTTCGCGKDVGVFELGQIIVLHQEET